MVFDPAQAQSSRNYLKLLETKRLIERDACKSSLFYLAKNVLGYKDLDETLHKPMTEAWQSEAPELMALIPRGHLKTTALTISYVIWLIIKTEGRCRVLLVNATLGNAKGFLRAITDHLEGRGSDSRFSKLFPEKCDVGIPYGEGCVWFVYAQEHVNLRIVMPSFYI